MDILHPSLPLCGKDPRNMASSTSIVPACIWRALENQYSEPNPRSSLLYYSPELCSSHKTGYHAFQEIGTHGCLDLYHGYLSHILYPREVFHLAIHAARQPNNGPAVVLLIIFMRKLSFND